MKLVNGGEWSTVEQVDSVKCIWRVELGGPYAAANQQCRRQRWKRGMPARHRPIPR